MPSSGSSPFNVIPQWLESLPLAPEYYPSLSEFSDPISFLLSIERHASSFGICKIVPPLPPPAIETTLSNLNLCFPTFPAQTQQIGLCPAHPRPAQKPVWRAGESYTFSQFQAKSEQFEMTQMEQLGKDGPFLDSEVETLFWRACAGEPFEVECASDLPGSGFDASGENGSNVGESEWNMRGVSRAKGSVLRCMEEEVPGVTSPVVNVDMMFSWFGWHVEDYELHGLDYLHMGKGKTWYGVPRDARFAFEEAVRVHGYGGEVNPLGESVVCILDNHFFLYDAIG